MNFTNYRTMDPFILYSFINTRLRDVYPDLSAFCEDNALDLQDFLDHMARHGFEYNETTNQFR